MMEMDIPETGRSLSEKLLGDRSEISYREIQQAVLPSFVKAWFHLGVETWYAPEYHQRTSSIRFDYKDETVQTLLKTFDDAVKQTALFSAEECRQIIETALRHEIAYANHSIGAFSDLMFQRSAVVDGFHVVDLLAHFQREHFFTEAVKSYVVEHDDTRMDRDILEHFLSGAQQEAYAKEPIAPLRDSVAAVSEILGLVDGNGHTGAFHPATWEKFVETRALEETLPVLPLAIERQKAIADVFDLATLEAALSLDVPEEDTAEGSTDEKTAEETDTKIMAKTKEKTLFGEIPLVFAPVRETRSEDNVIDEPPATFSVPDVEPVVEPFGVPESKHTPPPDEPSPATFAVPADYDTVPKPVEPAGQSSDMRDWDEEEEFLKKTVANTTTSASQNYTPPPVEINDKLQKMFVKKMFNKDEPAYQNTVEQLEPAMSWEEAFSIIEEIWQQRGLNLFSKESQEFTRVYYKRYFPPS